MKPMKKMWVVSQDYLYEGLGSPLGIFMNEEQARYFVDAINEREKRLHRRITDYDISETYVTPPSLEAIEEEDYRLFQESWACGV
jgi:hypothetical protein